MAKRTVSKSSAIVLKGDLPTPTVEKLPLHSLREQTDNVREEITTGRPEDVQMIRSLAINGQLAGHLFTISIRPDGTPVVVCGNRRTFFAKLVTDIERFTALKKSVKPEVFAGADPVTDGRLDLIECLVYRGLTEAQEAQIRADHVGTLKLSKWDRHTQVIQLWAAGLNSLQIESQTGISHGTAERELWRYEMGEEVEADYYNQLHGEDCLNLAVAELTKLHSQWNEDKRNSIELPDSQVDPKFLLFPNGHNKLFRKFGPISGAAWEEIKDKRAREAAGGPAPSEERANRTRAQHEANAELYKDAPFTSGYAKYAAGDKTIDLGELYTAEKAYIAEHKRLQRAVEDMAVQILDLRREKEELIQERNRLEEVIEEMEEASRERKQLEFKSGEVIDTSVVE